jgi:hypothetical protein
MDKGDVSNWDNLLLPGSKKSFSPITPKESWRYGSNLELLKKGLMQFNNFSQGNSKPKNNKEIVDNFERFKRNKHNTENSNPNECNPDIENCMKGYKGERIPHEEGLQPCDTSTRLCIDQNISKNLNRAFQ